MNCIFLARHKARDVRQSGFTLIEVMIVVAIVGLLASIALPSYRNYVLRGDRAVARAALLDAQLFMERFYATHNSFARTVGATTDDVALPSRLLSVPAGSPKYSIALSTTTPVTTNTFKLEATRLGSDPLCGVLSLTHTGVKDKTGTGTVAECWK